MIPTKFERIFDWYRFWFKVNKSFKIRLAQLFVCPVLFTAAIIAVTIAGAIALSFGILELFFYPITVISAYICGYSYYPMFFSDDPNGEREWGFHKFKYIK